MAFHFPVMPRMFMAIRREDALPMVEILESTPPIPDNAQWGLFLRNHDELTLEMVTDDERDYLYEEYAKDPRMKLNLGIRRRLAPLLDNGRDEIQLMHAILFSLPGSPVLYYGDEIGMGDNIFLGDRDGVRTPMQWTGDRNGGFSRADFQQLYLPPLMDPVYGFQAVNIEAQLRQPNSLLRWLHRLIALRKDHPVFGLGTYEALRPENPRIFAHVRTYEDDIVLCVHNLARSAQAVELDLSRWEGFVPEEMFGRTRFPAHRRAAVSADDGAARVLLVPAQEGRSRMTSERELIDFVTSQRWYGSKTRDVSHSQVVDRVVLREDDPRLELLLVEIRFDTGTHETYQLLADDTLDALADPRSVRELVSMMRRGVKLPGARRGGRVRARSPGSRGELREARPVGAEQSNTSIVFDDELILKVFRRLEAGINPELELLRFLTEHGFENIAQLVGWYSYTGRQMDATLGILQRFVSGRDGWEHALDTMSGGTDEFIASTRRLGEVTGRMHSILGSDPHDPSFCPEETSVESLGLLTATVDEEIESVFLDLPDDVPELEPIRGRGEEVRERLRMLTNLGGAGRVIRHHGDFHLGQTLWADGDWVILDFEGEPARSLPERRRKRSPLRDVAGMLRSFAYAASASPLLRGVEPPDGLGGRGRASSSSPATGRRSTSRSFRPGAGWTGC